MLCIQGVRGDSKRQTGKGGGREEINVRKWIQEREINYGQHLCAKPHCAKEKRKSICNVCGLESGF